VMREPAPHQLSIAAFPRPPPGMLVAHQRVALFSASPGDRNRRPAANSARSGYRRNKSPSPRPALQGASRLQAWPALKPFPDVLGARR
jgi:hypothetical protein